MLVRLDYAASGSVNPNYSAARYQARTYIKIRRRPSRQQMHRSVLLMSEVVA
jgi:hypothetical protein